MWRGRGAAIDAAPADIKANDDHRTPDEKRRAMTWAQRIKRVFGIDVSTCVHGGGAVRIVASIEEPTAIRAILAHFEKHDAMEEAHYRPRAARATGRGRVVARSATPPNSENQQPLDAAAIPQGGAWPDARIQ